VHHLLLRNPRNFCGGATVLPSERAIWKDFGLLASRISDSCSVNKFFTQEVWKKDQSLTANLDELSFIMLRFWAMHSVEKQGFQSGETAMNAEETPHSYRLQNITALMYPSSCNRFDLLNWSPIRST
jgi:hypothetical protein